MSATKSDFCEKDLSIEEILETFGKDDDLGKCANCNNLVYSNGIMTCKLIENFGGLCK